MRRKDRQTDAEFALAVVTAVWRVDVSEISGRKNGLASNVPRN